MASIRVYMSLFSMWVGDFPVLASRPETICIYSQQGVLLSKNLKASFIIYPASPCAYEWQENAITVYGQKPKLP